MRNKGLIITLSVVLAVISLYYLSFTFVVNSVEDDAADYANTEFQKMDVSVDELAKEGIIDSLTSKYLDSIENTTVYRLLKKYTYNDCKERELNLGLDLKGGMNISMEISANEIILALSNNPEDSILQKSLKEAARETESQTGQNFINVFGEKYKQNAAQNPEVAAAGLALLFASEENRDYISITSTDQEVLDYLNDQYEAAIESAFDVLRKRIDQYGVVQPNIQKDIAVKGVFHVELPGIKDPERVENLLKQAANLEFWETYNAAEISADLQEADVKITQLRERESGKAVDTADVAEIAEAVADTAPAVVSDKEAVAETNVITDEDVIVDDDSTSDELAAADTSVDEESPADEPAKINASSLFARLQPAVGEMAAAGPVVGFAKDIDKASIMADLNRPEIKSVLPPDLVFAWSFKESNRSKGYYELIALRKGKAGGKGAVLRGDVVTNAQQEFGQHQADASVSMTMNGPGAKEWANITEKNTGRSIAIVLDGAVYSYPNVNEKISGGRSSITGNFTLQEATDLANVLKSGKMPAPVTILSKEIVGPSLGQKSIDAGLSSFIIAFIVVLLYMILYYNKSGLVANVALITNIFLIFGVLASLGAVLTLPGIAGIVLTIGMSVDANVLIYERIREEIRTGKSIKSAIADGYKNAYSAILDSNITTLLIGIILLYFGVGPVKGFATTLIIGILCSLFCAIFITRIIFDTMLTHDHKITVGNKLTINAFRNVNLPFLPNRNKFFILSGAIILICLISLFTRGLNRGIDFSGGRNYVVSFQRVVDADSLANELEKQFDGERPIVKKLKAIESDSHVKAQVKISTKYKIDDATYDSRVDTLLYQGCKKFIADDVTMDEFYKSYRQSSEKVGPTVADDIKSKSIVAISIALVVMFLYILLRFRKWQLSLGAVAALVHDVIIVLGLFSLLYSIMPFSMEVDQSFIAAVLTVVGYSINDTVVIFDRIREYLRLYPKRDSMQTMNSAINSTLGRTINTSATTLVVLLAIFIFGGEAIQGFTFALLIGVIVGTYSSIFIASPLAFTLLNKKIKQNQLKK